MKIRIVFAVLFTLLTQLGYSQIVMPSFSASSCQSEVLYPLLHSVKKDSPAFRFSTRVFTENYLVVRPVPTMTHLPGMFCKLEYKIETKSKLAPRFRLGSLQYTEWMEGKGNYYMRYD